MNLKDIEFNCIYCNGKASSELMLVQVYAPGTYFQHWNLETQRGCEANKENKSPIGEIINNKTSYSLYTDEK
jgi:hypothetical protein